MDQLYTPGPEPSFKAPEESQSLEKIPEDAQLICAYKCFFNPVEFGESAFFRRIVCFDEPWIATCNEEQDPDYLLRDHSKRETFNDLQYRVGIRSGGTLKKKHESALPPICYHQLDRSCQNPVSCHLIEQSGRQQATASHRCRRLTLKVVLR